MSNDKILTPICVESSVLAYQVGLSNMSDYLAARNREGRHRKRPAPFNCTRLQISSNRNVIGTSLVANPGAVADYIARAPLEGIRWLWILRACRTIFICETAIKRP
jgi:hypothetical protein